MPPPPPGVAHGAGSKLFVSGFQISDSMMEFVYLYQYAFGEFLAFAPEDKEPFLFSWPI